jgi:hypothetical protein
MKRKQTELTTANKSTVDRMCEELGPDLVKKLHKALTLAGVALYKRAKQRAEAELQKADQLADQYRTRS